MAALLAEKFEIARDDNPWGLLSGALGAKPRRTKVAETLMGFESAVVLDDASSHPVKGEPSSLKPWIDLARCEKGAGHATWQRRWHDARADFTQRLAVVEEALQELQRVHEAMHASSAMQYETLAASFAEQQRALGRRREKAGKRQAKRARNDQDGDRTLRELALRTDQARAHRNDCRDRLEEAKTLHEPGWLARLLKKLFGLETRGWRAWKEEVQRARAALDKAKAAVVAACAAQAEAERKQAARTKREDKWTQMHEHEVRTMEERIADLGMVLDELEGIKAGIKAFKSRDGAPTLPDDKFLSLPLDEQHRRSLWVSVRLDQARSELFLSALRLHEATLMSTADSWFPVLGMVRTLLTSPAPAIAKADRAVLWQSLFFVLPVVSTTLASFGRLFKGLEQESLGWVLIDEAGQAPPAAVAGALWRARRAVVVGDPLQIEPVVTVPRKLVEQLGRNRGLDDAGLARWSPSLQSAQRLADRTMHLGTTVGDVWTGIPLRTHRRCMNPMFDIANRIAYEEQMVQATPATAIEPDPFPSCWIDVDGRAEGKVVLAQIDALARMLAALLHDWPQVEEQGKRKPASVYIISPFRDVAEACQDLVGRDSALGRKLQRHKLPVEAGTVHTFQGKEASIVFLVLGSAPGEAGAHSRAWAAAKPNLLNVALTRARQRFYVMGSQADWGPLPYFCQLGEAAGHLPRMRIDSDAGSGRLRLVPVRESAMS